MARKLHNWILASLLAVGSCGVGQRLEAQQVVPPQSPNESVNYALIIAPQTDKEDQKSIKKAYTSFLSEDFDYENIYVLNQAYKSDYPEKFSAATKEDLNNVRNTLEEKMDDNDFLFVYVTGEGVRDSTDKMNAYLPLQDGHLLTVEEMGNWLQPFEENKAIILFDQSYGGAFAYRLHNENHVTLSSCNSIQEQDNNFTESFFDAWVWGFGDNNLDEKVSVMEAYQHARRCPSKKEKDDTQQCYLANKNLADALILYW